MLSITTATIDDLIAIADIEQICFPINEGADFSTFQERFKVFPNHFLVAKINKEDDEDNDSEIIGFINGMVTNSETISDDMYEKASLHDLEGKYQTIFGINVLPSYQHLGVASKLMENFIQKAKKEKRTAVILTCKHHLISFYEQFGFVSLGISKSTHGGVVWYDMVLKL